MGDPRLRPRHPSHPHPLKHSEKPDSTRATIHKPDSAAPPRCGRFSPGRLSGGSSQADPSSQLVGRRRALAGAGCPQESGAPGRVVGRRAQGSEQPVGCFAQAVALGQRVERRRIGGIDLPPASRQLNRQVRHGRHDAGCPFEVLAVRRPQLALPQNPRDVPVAADHRGGADRADAAQPGQPVRRVSPQDREVGVPSAWDPVAADDLRLVDDGDPTSPDTAHGREDPRRARTDPGHRWRSRPSR